MRRHCRRQLVGRPENLGFAHSRETRLGVTQAAEAEVSLVGSCDDLLVAGQPLVGQTE